MKLRSVRKCLDILVVIAVVALVTTLSEAAYIDTRTELEDTVLQGNFEFDDFNGYGVSVGDRLLVGSSFTSSTGAVFLTGPGTGSEVQLNGQGYYGQPSPDVTASNSHTIIIDFSNIPQAIIAFGVDLLTYEGNIFVDWNESVAIQIIGNNGTTLFNNAPTPISLSDDAPIGSVFFGFSDDTGVGISQVLIVGSNSAMPGSPAVDNLSFGSQVPVPGALWLLGSGLLCVFGLRKRMIEK